jgi:hypothetical protein
MAAAELKNHFMRIADQALQQSQALLHPTTTTSITTSSPTRISSVSLLEPIVDVKVKEEGEGEDVHGGDDLMEGGVEGDTNREGKIRVNGKGEGQGQGGLGVDPPSSSAPPPVPITTASPSLLAAMMEGLVPSVRAVAYATPPCVCEVRVRRLPYS